MLESRKEYKFVISGNELENFKNLNSKNLKVLHESRFIESLYFDTWDLELYKSSFNLDIDKYKYRLRKGIDGKIYSEIKMNKANGKFKEKNLTHFKSLDQTESIFYHNMSLHPTLYVSYSREYLNLNNSVRVTIDQNIYYKSSKKRSLLEINKQSHNVILEYKFLDNKKLDIENYFFKNPVTFSKYVDGINRVYKERNNF